MFIKVGIHYVNPYHITMVTDEGSGGCVVHVTGSPQISITGTPAAEAVAYIAAETDRMRNSPRSP
jgi:hypothetical protein